MVRLMLICGSVRAGSTNAAALRCAAESLADGVTALNYHQLGELPHFNPDLDVDPLPAPVAELRRAIGESAAVLFSTPEYAGALPGSLKNLLDWTIGGGELSDKPVGWINSSDRGAAGAYAELATVLRYAGARVVPAGCARITVSRSEVDADGAIGNPAIRAAIADVVRALQLTASEANLTPGM
jgi:chromate reductase, NAD(P)H dehydrogenase (quinone)